MGDVVTGTRTTVEEKRTAIEALVKQRIPADRIAAILGMNFQHLRSFCYLHDIWLPPTTRQAKTKKTRKPT